MTVKLKASKEELKNKLDTVMNSETATQEDVISAQEAYFMAIAEDAAKQVKAEYEELSNVKDDSILQARGIHVLTAQETKFYNEVAKTGGFDDTQVWPETIFERVFEDLQEEHPILQLVNFTPTVGRVKVIRSRRKGKAVWGPLHKDLEGQLDAEFGQTEYTQLALTAFFLISNDTLDLGPRWINRYIQLSLKEAISDSWEEVIVSGTGNNQPIGLLKDLDGSVTKGAYPDKASAGTLTFKDPATMVTEFAGVLSTMSKYKHKIGDGDEGVDKFRKVGGKLRMIINPVNYYEVVARTTSINASGDYVTKIPFVGAENIIESVHVPADKLIIFVEGQYDATQSRPEKTYEYKETFAMQRATLYAVDMLGNGQPRDNYAAQVYDIAIPVEGATGE
ncbi:phage major capsid protein [Ruoffia tabacinasalis]|uniref:Phage major capsid protein n=1 Tax=Ruoffia tabacinasalis TaxID=87458 RepID=A0A5R9EGI7_9LACT|nr:phage major capsid protein [Ruoffia tabacinasalis]TLQ49284.1 phage major capsid protein [Ruoffia tabacinasalis]